MNTVRYDLSSFFFFFNDTATTEIYTLSLHDALPISQTHSPSLTEFSEIIIIAVNQSRAGGTARATLNDGPKVKCHTQANKRKATPMTIQITKPEVEALINQRLQSGGFKDAEDVILQALQSSPSKPSTTPQPDTAHPEKSLREVFEAVKGLADDLDFSRNPSTGRPADLS